MLREKSLEEMMRCELCNKSYNEFDVPRVLTQESDEKTACNQCISNLKLDDQDKPLLINELALSFIKATEHAEKVETLRANLNESSVNKLKEECNKLRKEIQLLTEQRIKELYELNAALVKQIDEYEKISLIRITSNDVDLEKIKISSNRKKDENNQDEDNSKEDDQDGYLVSVQMIASMIASNQHLVYFI